MTFLSQWLTLGHSSKKPDLFTAECQKTIPLELYISAGPSIYLLAAYLIKTLLTWPDSLVYIHNLVDLPLCHIVFLFGKMDSMLTVLCKLFKAWDTT